MSTTVPVASLFPLDAYPQSPAHWFDSQAVDYQRPILTAQQQATAFKQFKRHVFSTEKEGLSPWSARYINYLLQSPVPDDLVSLEKSILQTFSNQHKPENKLGYALNFRLHTLAWSEKLEKKMDLDRLKTRYQSKNRAIAIDNTVSRLLPTYDVHFYHDSLPGESYPFDNLQNSAIWAGTPLYVFHQTSDKAWSLVASPSVISWVPSAAIANVSSTFIKKWLQGVETQLLAMTKNQTPVIDQAGHFRFSAYVGTVLPGLPHESGGYRAMIPIKKTSGDATITTADLTEQQATPMPLSTTPKAFIDLMNTLLGRPYGWGGLYFYNDCSAELKSLYTPFGLWLPRHSTDQITLNSMEDFSHLTKKERIDALLKNGKPFTTIVYIGKHIFTYLGPKPNPHNASEIVPLTLQNIWGLTPHTHDSRSVIGQSVFLPLLQTYPENPALISLADKKYFKMAYLHELKEEDLDSDEVIPSSKTTRSLLFHGAHQRTI